MIVLIIGLPGSGKTTLASQLATYPLSVILDGDVVRNDLSKDLSFSLEDRIEQARRIGAVARILDDQGFDVYCSFVCPTNSTRESFGNPDLTVWMNRMNNRQFDDSTQMWENPENALEIQDGLTINQEVSLVRNHMR